MNKNTENDDIEFDFSSDMIDFISDDNANNNILSTIQTDTKMVTNSLLNNRTRLLYRDGLIRFPKDAEGENINKSELNKMNSSDYNEFILYISNFLADGSLSYLLHKTDKNGSYYINYILSLLNIHPNERVSIKNDSKFRDALHRCLTLCKTVDEAETYNEIISSYTERSEKVKKSMLHSEFMKHNYVMDKANISEYSCKVFVNPEKGECQADRGHLYTIRDLFDASVDDSIKSIYEAENSIIMKNLILWCLTTYFSEKINGIQVETYNKHLFDIMDESFLNDTKFLQEFSKYTSIKPYGTNNSGSLYDAFVKYTYMLAVIVAEGCLPNQHWQFVIDNAQHIMSACINNIPIDSVSEEFRNKLDLAKRRYDYIIKTEKKVLYSGYNTAVSVLSGEVSVYLDKEYLKKIPDGDMMTKVDVIYTNIFNIFSHKMKFLCKDLTLKVFEPANELMFSNTSRYFDNNMYDNINEVIENIDRIVNL